jgi:hypothetical protein
LSSAFGSSVLEVGIGIALMYLLLSLVVTVINELIAQALALRARTLEQGLQRLLEGTPSTPQADTLLQKLANLRLPLETSTPGPSDAAATAGQSAARAAPRPILDAAAVLKHPLIVSLSPPHGLPSYIPAREFAIVLLDLVAPDVDPNATDYVKQVRQSVTDIQGNDHLKQSLLALLDKSEQDVQSLRTAIENWFDDAMARVSGWYKRKVTKILFVVGLVLTLLVNADSLGVAQTLWLNPAERAAVVSAAQSYVARQATPQPAGATPASVQPTPATFESEGRNLANDVTAIEGSRLPLGWATFPPQDILREVVGLLITAFAISLGAPFWFDLLSTFVNVRSAGPPGGASSSSR